MAERLLDRVGLEKIAGTIELASSTAATPDAGEAPAATAAPVRAAARVVGRRARDAARRLERPARRDRARLLATTSSARRCTSRRSTRAATATRFALRFRCARTAGYGASPGMVRRCLERCDDDDIVGAVRSCACSRDTHPVQHAGPGVADLGADGLSADRRQGCVRCDPSPAGRVGRAGGRPDRGGQGRRGAGRHRAATSSTGSPSRSPCSARRATCSAERVTNSRSAVALVLRST